MAIVYSTGDPVESGIYAVRVPSDDLPGFHEDKFLLWYADKWNFLRSDQSYRGEVYGWIGPLARTNDRNRA